MNCKYGLVCALEQSLVRIEKLSQKRVDSLLATSFWKYIFINRVYVCYVKLSHKRPDFEKPSRDRGPQPRTLYSFSPGKSG